MDWPLTMVLVLLGVAMVLFVTGRPRMDVVAVIMMLALPLTGVVSMAEALMGFADPNIVLIAALFVIGEALVRTGVAQRMGDWLTARAGASEGRVIVLLMLVVAGMSAFMSSTAVVAIFIPIVLRIVARTRIPAARLMMPLSMAALISGMLTLVGTPPNLVVNAELTRQGHEGFGFFAFTPFGLPILLLAMLYMLGARRYLSAPAAPAPPDRPALADWVAEYGLADRGHRLRLLPGSALAGARLDVLDLRASEGISIIAIERGRGYRRHLIQPRGETVLQPGDTLLIERRSDGPDLDGLARAQGLEALPLSARRFADTAQEIGMAQMIVPPGSRLIGQTVTQARFRSRFGLSVIGLKHGAQPVPDTMLEEPLRAGDTLLTMGPWRAIAALAGERRDLVVLDMPVEYHEVVPVRARAPLALAVVALVVGLMVWGAVPHVQAALFGCLLMGLFRIIDIDGAYRSIHWQSLILIVGMMPFSLALQRTGGVDMAAEALLAALGDASPRLVLAAVFAATAGISLIISNTATAVLMAPVALALASVLGASPYPFAMTVALAASAAFMTPVASPVNTLVVGPGNYRFTDFLCVGGPFTLICGVVVVALVPVVLPF